MQVPWEQDTACECYSSLVKLEDQSTKSHANLNSNPCTNTWDGLACYMIFIHIVEIELHIHTVQISSYPRSKVTPLQVVSHSVIDSINHRFDLSS